MNALFLPPHLVATMYPMNFPGWTQSSPKVEAEDVDSKNSSMETAAVAQRSASHQHKRRRLSRLLDRLSEQLRNNNHYPNANPRWLDFHSPREKEDVPLDLSMKAEPIHPIKEEESFSCSVCGQTFAMHDRLAKHIASRHRNRTPDAQRQYECDICQRRFARSDMLTRHARLHSGVKPYACPVCGQVFSRSDHLATHQRTHTGEKPYRCPACPYAACRRDMITRHMRTHTRKENLA